MSQFKCHIVYDLYCCKAGVGGCGDVAVATVWSLGFGVRREKMLPVLHLHGGDVLLGMQGVAASWNGRNALPMGVYVLRLSAPAAFVF